MQCLFAVQRQAKPCLASPGTAFPKAVHKVIHRNRGQEKNRLKNQELGLRTGPWGRAAQHAPSSKAGRCKGLDKAGKGKLCTEAILVSRGISACTARLKNRNTLSQAFELKKFFCLFRVGGKFSQPLQKCARLQDVNKVIHRTLAGKKSFCPFPVRPHNGRPRCLPLAFSGLAGPLSLVRLLPAYTLFACAWC